MSETVKTTDTGVTPDNTLFNPDIDENYLFEQYKLYVEMADRISQRRATSNTFYITANAALVTVASWFKGDFGNYIYLVSGTSVIMALFWFFSIRSYKQLNTGKFAVIHEIERCLPLNLYSYEWDKLGKGKCYKTYWPLSHIEGLVPFIFIALNVALSLFAYFNL